MQKAISKAVSDTVVERLKTPLIATFICSWIIVNHSTVLEFTFETLPNKVILAKNLKIDWWFDLWLPTIVSLGYILIIPALQLILDWGILKTIGKSRTNHDIEFARNSARSTVEYQTKLLDKELANWQSQKEDLLREVYGLNQKTSDLTEKIQNLNVEKNELDTSNKLIQKTINQALNNLESAYIVGSTDQRSREQLAEEVIEMLEPVINRNRDV
ncbi:hypothetical protein BCT47_16390 [Vibrio splendidus]|uniref:ATPase subunit I n=1 Tax=Vibrio splendidus TaxID=29497 RepID=A0AB35N2Z3_VIBSP|nr:hypothetical protein [Vibrio splendidus]MDP2502625.1 hypothetical protein [Vibrio splendidus]PMM76404.1 hypothetical protein BCT47_16390 [Vibrio splendidus]